VTDAPLVHTRARELTEGVEVSQRSNGQRQLSFLIVPWDKPTEVAELIDGVPTLYTESFARGSLDRALKAPHRAAFQIDHPGPYEHQRGSLERLAGYGHKFEDSAEGMVGTFTLYPSQADRAVELVTSSHRWASVDFVSITPRRGVEKAGAHIVRRAAHLNAVAAVVDPAYTDANLLAVRADAEHARELLAAESAQRESMLGALGFLVGAGLALNAEQLEWLAAHDVDPATLAAGTP